MRIEPLGDSALLVQVVDEFHPSESLDAIVAATRALAAADIPGIVELVPAYTTIALFFEPPHDDFALIESKVERLLQEMFAKGRLAGQRASRIDVPVCYEDEFAPDLNEVSRQTGLPANEIIDRHSRASYRVSCVGFTPGFPYLSGLPAELATPRRASPRKEIPAGAVAIGGSQTGIYPRKSPGGWNIIGRTPLRLFDVERDRPALFEAGDHVRFCKISRTEFDRMSS